MMHKLTHKALANFFSQGERLVFKKGEVVAQSSEKPQDIYYIEQGYIKIFSYSNTDEQYIHIIYGPGEIFPIAWLASEELRPQVAYAAIGPCTLRAVSYETAMEKLEHDHEFSLHIMHQVSDQFMTYTARVDNLEYKYASERLAYRLAFLASRFGEKRPDGSILIKPPITHQILGQTINLSRESVTREMEKLLRKGSVGYEKQKIVIQDVHALTRQFKAPLRLDWWGLNTEETNTQQQQSP